MQFAPGWKMTLLVAILLPTVLALGTWQMNRGVYKRAMETDYLGQLTALPVAARELDPAVRFQRVRLIGEFLPQAFLVDNQILDGQVGYWLVQGFRDIEGQRFLVNRGYIAGTGARDRLPPIDTPSGQLQVVGAIWPFTGLLPVLDEDVWAEDWPKRVQRMDIKRMAASIDAQPIEVRLEPGQPGVAAAAPFAQVLSDAKHRGYAATWFGLAAALVVAYAAFGFKTGREQSVQPVAQKPNH